MKSKINYLLVSVLTFILMSLPLYSDHDSYLAIIKDDVATEFASYNPQTIDLQLNSSEYTIDEDFSNIENYRNVSYMLDERSKALLRENGFAVVLTPPMDKNSERMYSIYRTFKSNHIPLFITTDSMLHTFHILYDYSLRVAELENFIGYIEDITEVMLIETSGQMDMSSDPFVKDALKRNHAYFAVAMKLLDPGYDEPAEVSELVNREIALIDAHTGKDCSPIFGYYEDYVKRENFLFFWECD